MTDTTDRPLVSFAVIAYNQERFIREAIEGAFAQTYQPLEIILSDDGSPDRTYEIMQDMAAAYDGPHKIVLNRNEPNLGLVPHVNRIFDLASGDLLCVNAGDDFSRPDRVDVLYNNWDFNGGKHDIIHTSAYDVDEHSKIIRISRPRPNILERNLYPKTVAKEFTTAIGATFMYTKRLIEAFGELPSFAEVEDRPMIFRASLSGGLLFIDEPLLFHRQGGVSDIQIEQETRTYRNLFGSRIKLLSWRVSSAKCYLADLDALDKNMHEVDTKRLKEFIINHEWEISLSRATTVQRLKMLPDSVMRSFLIYKIKPFRTYMKYLTWPLASNFIRLKHYLIEKVKNFRMGG